MRFVAFRCFTVTALLAMASLSFFLPAAQAEPAKVYLLGLHAGCERLAPLERMLERRLFEKGQVVYRVDAEQGDKPLSCTGIECAHRFTAQCKGVGGRLLWGQVVPGRNVTKTRLYLYETSTQQVAVQDDWCQGCDAASAVTSHAEQLLRAPRFLSAAPSGSMPTYCSGAGPVAVSPAVSAPLYLTVYGDGKQRGALSAALRQQLTILGRRVLSVPGEPGKYSSDVLRKIVAGQPGAQVLGADAQKDGSVLLFLYDGAADQTDGKTVTCPDCERDQQISQVKQAVAELLEKCFGERCSQGSGSAGAAGASAVPPPEACEAFAESSCSSPLTESKLPPRHIDSSTAALVKGLTWGMFGVTAATAGVLTALNATPVADLGTYRNTMGDAAWAALGLSGVALAVAVPVHLSIRKAEKGTQRTAEAVPAGERSVCPN